MQIFINTKVSPWTHFNPIETEPIEQAELITPLKEQPKNGQIINEDQRNIKKRLASKQSKALVINPLRRRSQAIAK